MNVEQVNDLLSKQDEILFDLYPCQEFVCPECGSIVMIQKGRIVQDCDCGAPVFRKPAFR